MERFNDMLSDKDADDVHAYLIEQSWIAYREQEKSAAAKNKCSSGSRRAPTWRISPCWSSATGNLNPYGFHRARIAAALIALLSTPEHGAIWVAQAHGRLCAYLIAVALWVIQATKKGIRMMQEGRRRRVAALAAAVRGLAEKEIVQLLQAAQVMERLSRQV